MRLPTAGGSTMVSQSRYACGTMRVMRDHNTSATLSRDLIPDPNVSGRGYDTSASHVWVHRLAQKPIPPMPLARSEEHTSELQSLMRNSYAVFCLKKTKNTNRDST